MQSNIVFRHDINRIFGNLKYFENGLADSGPLAGAGHFLAFKMTAEDWSDFDTVKIGMVPSASDMGLVDIKSDADHNGVFKISSPTQKLRIEYKVSDTTTTVDYDLTGLSLE